MSQVKIKPDEETKKTLENKLTFGPGQCVVRIVFIRPNYNVTILNQYSSI